MKGERDLQKRLGVNRHGGETRRDRIIKNREGTAWVMVANGAG